MGRTWYCKLNGCEIGPLSSGGLGQLAANGQLEPDDLIRNAAEPDWRPARQLKGLKFSRSAEHSQTAPIGWYFRDGTVTFGPYSSTELITLGTLGLVRPLDYIRRGANGDWVRANHVKGLRLRSDQPSQHRDHDAPSEKPSAIGSGIVAADIAGPDIVDTETTGPDAAGPDTVGPDATDADAIGLDDSGFDDPQSFDNGLQAQDDDSQPPDDSQIVNGSQATRNGSQATGNGAPRTANGAPAAEDRADSLQTTEQATERSAELTTKYSAEPAPSTPPKSTNSQFNDILVALFVILPCILPAFGPAVGGLTGTAIAIAASALGLTLFYKRWQPTSAEIGWAAASAAFIAIFGATTLLQFTEFSVALAEGAITWNYAPLSLIKGIGSVYLAATERAYTDSQVSFAEIIGPTIFSVGLFEEALKLLPAMLAFSTSQVTRPQGLLFIAAATGLAFGIAEGIWMLSHYPTQPTLSNQIVRLAGGAACHAAMTSLAVALFLWTRQRLPLRPSRAWEVVVGLGVLLVIATVHGLYDTLLVISMVQEAGLVMIALVTTLLLVDRRSADNGGVAVT